ncbi:MAG: hypothetical protein KBB95_29350, partial [Deltaproteobacteria bacterium]|nr:hypothetical protein [Deltaproteobacteria bacterium]
APRLREELERWRTDLRAIADEVRVKIHLGSLEAKDAWSDLEPKVHEFEQRAEKVKTSIGSELKQVGAGLKHVGDDLKHVGKDLEHAGTTLKSELVRLRDRLAKG